MAIGVLFSQETSTMIVKTSLKKPDIFLIKPNHFPTASVLQPIDLTNSTIDLPLSLIDLDNHR
jgi:hypothetical protein